MQRRQERGWHVDGRLKSICVSPSGGRGACGTGEHGVSSLSLDACRVLARGDERRAAAAVPGLPELLEGSQQDSTFTHGVSQLL